MQLNPEISMPYHGADLMTCDPGKLVDLKDVHIDTSLPVEEGTQMGEILLSGDN